MCRGGAGPRHTHTNNNSYTIFSAEKKNGAREDDNGDDDNDDGGDDGDGDGDGDGDDDDAV